jgi:hypothetical protein
MFVTTPSPVIPLSTITMSPATMPGSVFVQRLLITSLFPPLSCCAITGLTNLTVQV